VNVIAQSRHQGLRVWAAKVRPVQSFPEVPESPDSAGVPRQNTLRATGAEPTRGGRGGGQIAAGGILSQRDGYLPCCTRYSRSDWMGAAEPRFE